MANRTILGIDIGHTSLKLSLINNGVVVKCAFSEVPTGLIKEGKIVSIDAMSEIIKATIKNNGIKCSQAALILSEDVSFVRNLNMPVMTKDQLMYNIPYEFDDYITEEAKNYIFDYAMISDVQPGDESMDLTAVATKNDYVDELRLMCRKAGLKLVSLSPAFGAYSGLIRHCSDKLNVPSNEYCFVDLGYDKIRMYMFKGDSFVASREIDTGLATVENIVANNMNVDVHIAHTYLTSNHGNCQSSDFCKNAFASIAVELKRAMNFYNFSNPDSHLEDVWLCGGGALIAPLFDEISENLDMMIHQTSDFIPGVDDSEIAALVFTASGIAMNY